MHEEYRKLLEQLAAISLNGELCMGVGDIEFTPSHMLSPENNYFNKKAWGTLLCHP